MNYSFEYIDIILLAMIAGFIFLRLRGILGKRTGFEGKAAPQFEEILKNIDPKAKSFRKETFDEEAQKEFLRKVCMYVKQNLSNLKLLFQNFNHYCWLLRHVWVDPRKPTFHLGSLV